MIKGHETWTGGVPTSTSGMVREITILNIIKLLWIVLERGVSSRFSEATGKGFVNLCFQKYFPRIHMILSNHCLCIVNQVIIMSCDYWQHATYAVVRFWVVNNLKILSVILIMLRECIWIWSDVSTGFPSNYFVAHFKSVHKISWIETLKMPTLIQIHCIRQRWII